MQQLVGVHFAQPVQQQGDDAADEVLPDAAAAVLDMLLQRAAALVAHYHVRRLVGAEEIQHPHHVGVAEARERFDLLEKTLHAVTESGQVLRGDRGQHIALVPERKRGGQVLLDRHRHLVLVVGEIDDGKAAA